MRMRYYTTPIILYCGDVSRICTEPYLQCTVSADNSRVWTVYLQAGRCTGLEVGGAVGVFP